MRSILRITADVVGGIGAILFLLWSFVDSRRFESFAGYLPPWPAATLGICGLFYVVWDMVVSWPRKRKPTCDQKPTSI